MFAKIAIALLGTLSAAPALAQPPLDDLAWKARPVLVFAAGPDDPHAQLQIDALRVAHAGMNERAMVLIAVFDAHVEEDGVLSERSPEELRRAYDVAPGTFEVVLIGKDTGVKRRSTAYVEPESLFAQVDGMPMRRDEMRRRAG